MKKVLLLFSAILLLTSTQANDFNESMAKIMTSMHKYTIAIIKKMPEDQFGYRPTEDVRTFREQVQHMAEVQNYFLYYQLKNRPENVFTQPLPDSKDALLEIIDRQYQELIRFYEKATKSDYEKQYLFESKDGSMKDDYSLDYYALAMLIRDHISHHRGQMIVYLRLNHIQPPPYYGY